MIPLDELPGPAQAVARALPSGALAEVVRGTLTAACRCRAGVGRARRVGHRRAPLATRLFRWEDATAPPMEDGLSGVLDHRVLAR